MRTAPGADAREQAVADGHRGVLCRHEAADLRQHHDQGDLLDEDGLAGAVGAGDED
jgi:hypothetical protein